MLPIITGAGIALAVTIALACFFGFGLKDSGRGYGSGFILAIRAIVEVVLVVGFVGALVATAVVGTASAWQLFGAYAAVRAGSLILEVIASK